MEDSLSSISIPVPRSPPGENPGTLFVEDEVCLRTNMAVTGIVMRTWHDVDAPRYRMDTGQAIFDSSTTIATRHQFLHQGQPPRGHVVVQFGDQSIALQLRPESQLILLDRAFQFGDIVKKSATEEMSGTVIRIGITCDIRPSCVSSTPLGSSSSRLDLYDIPGEELTLNGDFQEGDFVIFKDWVGVVEDLEEEVTLRLSDGGVVVLEDSLEVEIPLDPTSPIESSSIESEDGSRAHNGRARGQRYAASVAAPNNGHQTLAKSAPVDRLSEGQYVTTKKWNLRRGRWKYGSYNPNTSPQGFVVEVHPIFLWVRWLCSNVMTPGHTPSFTRPDERLEPSDFERSDFRRYDLGRVPRRTTTTKSSADESEDELSPLGGLRGACLQTGDYVRFCDLAGALVKYGGHGQTRDGRPQGTLTKIDRADMQGYDLNTFIITRTSSRVGVMWQDLSESDKPSTSLIPYLNIDELDVWPGELVTTKLSEVSSDGLNERKYSPTGNVCNGVGQQQHPLPSISRTILSRPLESGSILPDGQLAPGSRLGITQAVNARDRVAGVRWFANPQIAFTSEMPPQVLPGSLLGPLRHEVQQTSVYEMHAHQSLMKRRGDFVVIAGKTPVHVDDVDWFGEVVDIRLDGSISVRLAAAKECRDVNLPTEQVTVVYGDDDDQSYSGDDESDSTDDDNSSGSGEGRQYPYNDGREVLETIEYEGGDRIMSDGGEEMWSTDDEAVSIAPLDTEFAMEDAPDMTDDEGLEGLASRYSTPPEHSQIESNTTPRNRVRARISSPGQILPHMGDAPQNFAVLECSPPLNHAFIDRIGGGSRNSRLAREYRILEEGLPEGNIWVRTWESRFNIARVLILGPRGTPYSLAPFVMDFHFGTGFPEEPPEAYFHSWTNGYGRINPNLYEDGKVCLSLLGTWPADAKNEGWSSKSTFLQVLVSLMGLVLVKEPYYNEAGYDILIDSPATAVSSTHYTERAYTIGRAFVRHALTSSVDGINDVIRWLYLPSIPGGLSLLKEVVAHSKLVLERSTPTYNQVELPTDGEECKESGGVRTISAGAAQLLRRHVTALEDLLASDLAKSNPSSSHATSQELPSVQ